MCETEKERAESQKEILTKPRYTHKSFSVACPTLVFYSYALAEQDDSWVPSTKNMLPLLFSPSPSVVSVLRLSFFILLCHLTISFSPSQLFLLSFLWLPSVLLPCMLHFAIYLCRFARIPPSSLSHSEFLCSLPFPRFTLQVSSQHPFLISPTYYQTLCWIEAFWTFW